MSIIGSSVLLRRGEEFLFEIQKPVKWTTDETGVLSVGLGCIGGSVEGSESPREALVREIREEIGCRVSLKTPRCRFFVGQDGAVRELAPRDLPEDLPESAAFLWEGGGPGFIPGIQVAVFLGEPVGRPVPGDLPAIIWMKLDILFECGGSGLTVGEAVGRGARLLEKQSIPKNARLTPAGTPKILIELRKNAPDILKQVIDFRMKAEERGPESDIERLKDETGRIKRWPKKAAEKFGVLRYIQGKFTTGKEYSEKEANEIINRWHAFGDHALIRRELFDRYLINRTRDGRAYWIDPNRGEGR